MRTYTFEKRIPREFKDTSEAWLRSISASLMSGK